MRSPVSPVLPLAVIALVAGCGLGGSGGGLASSAPPSAATGPAADYPMVIGEPFTIDAVGYTPADTLNYDAVGYAALDEGATGVSAAHKTLPLPSYVEITAIDSGKSILARVERRGPMTNDRLIELSPDAVAQLGITSARAPVRVRRVNPPEPERAQLRSGNRAPDRMATPPGLLAALRRKLDAAGASAAAALAPATVPAPAAQASVVPASLPVPTPSPEPSPAPAPRPAATPAASARSSSAGGIVVQIAAFSTRDRAEAAAAKISARVVPAGRFWRMQLGPFATRGEAEAALGKARAAGYSDARIQRAE